MSKQTFQVGDIVEWCGVRGKVVSVDEYNEVFPLKADFDFSKVYFTPEGKYLSWHKEPSLKLIERSKKKVKFKDWKKGKYYKISELLDTYILQDGLPFSTFLNHYSTNDVSWFAKNEFEEFDRAD